MQSAFARHVLNRQLLALAFLNPSEHHRTEMDVVFNDGTIQGCAVVMLSILIRSLVWANNGDAISRC